MKYLWIGLGVIILIAGIIFFFTNKDAENTNLQPGNSMINGGDKVNTEDFLIIGDEEAPVTIIEFGDFKCPTCTAFHITTGKELREKYIDGGLVRILYLTLPIIGPDSPTAAHGAYCANEQSKFTQFHDLVYDYMDKNYYDQGNFSAEFDDILNVDKLVELGSQASIDPEKLRDCIDSQKFEDLIKRDIDVANMNGAGGTPTFFIGDQKITGFQQFSVFKTLIELELRQ